MSNAQHCPRCGAELADESPEGLCPACLLKTGLASDPDEAPTVTAPGDIAAGPRDGSRLAQGDTFGHYEIVRLLGKGGMGEVYEALDRDTQRSVALKVLAQKLDSPRDRDRFLREGRLAAQISHPNSVYVFGAEEIHGIPVISMELVPGKTLKEQTKEGPLGVSGAVDAILQVIDGLEAAAEKGILHRDVKPSNCFVGPDGSVKIGDFGLSISTLAREDTQLTSTGSFLGTPAFASSEQLQGKELDVRSDIYSVGATLFYLLTGRPPFDQRNAAALMSAILNESPPDLRTLRSEVPKGLAKTVVRCLAKDPSNRFASYTELKNELARFSSLQLTPATRQTRFWAFLADVVCLGVPMWVGLDALHAAGFIGESWRLWLIPLSVAYFGITEGIWGASVGKALIGITVVDATRGSPPGLSRAFARVGLFLMPALLSVLVPAAFALGLTGVVFGVVFVFAVVAGLVLVPLSIQIPLRGVHETLSATRVVLRPNAAGVLAKRKVDTTPLAMPAVEEQQNIGPYDVVGTLSKSDGDELILGFDPVLSRQVWIRIQPPGTPETPVARRELNRPGRLRWLGGTRTDTECWDSFEAPEGQPFLELVTAGLRWSTVARWMIDLAEEGNRALEDPAPLTVGLDRVWIVPNHRALIVDFPVPGVEPRAASLLNDVDSLQTFLGELVSTGLLGGVHLRSFLFPFDIDTGGAKTPRGPAYQLHEDQQRTLRRMLGETAFGLRSHRREFLERVARAEFLTANSLVRALRDVFQRDQTTVTTLRTLTVVFAILAIMGISSELAAGWEGRTPEDLTQAGLWAIYPCVLALTSWFTTRGTSKSAVSRRFVAQTQAQLDAWRATPLDALDLAGLLIDGVHVGGHCIVVALGIDKTGAKHPLGLWEGATENATVCQGLLTNLASRGLRTDRSLLVIVDGAQALDTAVTQTFGRAAVVQRCQVHKGRNILEHLPEAQRPWVKAILTRAYTHGNVKTAKRLLQDLARRLDTAYPSAAASVRDGLDETLTVLGLGLSERLQRSLATTNAIESLLSRTRHVKRNVKRWRGGMMVLRWVAAGVLEAAKGFRRVKGCQDMPALVAALRARDARLGLGESSEMVA